MISTDQSSIKRSLVVPSRLAVAAADDVMREHKVLAFIIRFCFAGFDLSRSEPYMPSLEYVGHSDRRRLECPSFAGRTPEHDGVLQPFKSGVGLLAVNLDVPVVPVKTIGLFGTVPLHCQVAQASQFRHGSYWSADEL